MGVILGHRIIAGLLQVNNNTVQVKIANKDILIFSYYLNNIF